VVIRERNKVCIYFSELSGCSKRSSDMSDDEKSIRELVERWMNATQAGDLETVLTLMADDVVFMVPGQEPFGKDVFAENSRRLAGMKIEGTSNIQEIEVLGGWAWMRNHLQLKITFTDGKTVKRSGYTLTLLRKRSDGSWVIMRDANLLTTVAADSA
jgi:uncharacterized protein (TIGR02246 family)